jgi:tRNA threonylcarbamoyladenosine biosynthesis protein TsaE
MGKPALSLDVPDEAALAALAGRVALDWQARADAGRALSDAEGRAGGHGGALTLGLSGDLGAGKTTWVRAMLRALGYTARVPSPTYTLMEIYQIGSISLIHMDLYRIAGDDELEQLGIRDYLGQPSCWLIAEWPQRAPQWFARCDITVDIQVRGAQARRIECAVHGAAAPAWLSAFELT